MMKEASIIINGMQLTEGESMTVRVAIEALASVLSEEDSHDGLADEIRHGYFKAINTLRDNIARLPE